MVQPSELNYSDSFFAFELLPVAQYQATYPYLCLQSIMVENYATFKTTLKTT